jgi:hypothetical protein
LGVLVLAFLFWGGGVVTKRLVRPALQAATPKNLGHGPDLAHAPFKPFPFHVSFK